MAAQINSLADAVAADLRAASEADRFPLRLAEVRRTRLPILDKDRLPLEPILLVVSASDDGERVDRGGTWQREYEIHLSLQQKLARVESEEADKLAELAERIADFYTERPRPTGRSEALTEAGYILIYNPDQLQNSNHWHSVIRFVFRGYRGGH